MWEDMYQMSLDTSGLGVERHASLPEMSKSDLAEWKEKENPFERRSSFTTISNTKKGGVAKKGKIRRHRSEKRADAGYITQTFLNEKITWDEELNISSKSPNIKAKKQTISLKNSIQALLEANDSLVTDSYKTLKDANEFKSSYESLPTSDTKEVLAVTNGDSHDKVDGQNGHVENLGNALLKEHALYTQLTENNENNKVAYSYTIDAELSYQEYNKLMHIIVNTLKEKRKWEEFIKEAEEKMDITNKERLELMDNNKVLRESLEAANKAIKDISGKVQKLKESLGPLRDENNYLKQVTKEQKGDIDQLIEEKKLLEKALNELTEASKNLEEKETKDAEIDEYKKTMHDKFRKLEDAYRNYQNEMEAKHDDMNRTIEDMKQLNDNAQLSVEGFQKENITLRREMDAITIKNEQLTTEIKERWETDKKLITANAETQIRYEQSQKCEDEYKKQIKDTKEEIEKQKWEVFFSKEEATSLEKENKLLKSTISSLEDKLKLVERKYEMVEKEREGESKQSRLLREELKDMKSDLLELNDLKKRNIEVNKEIEVYKKQETTLQELRVEFEAMKKENSTQHKENEKLRADVEKLKNETSEAERAKQREIIQQQQAPPPPPQPQVDPEMRRLLNEMEVLRNQLKNIDENQNLGSTPNQNEIKIELEAMRKEMSAFLEAMHARSEENETKTIKQDLGELKRQISEMELIGRSKSSSMNRLMGNETYAEQHNGYRDEEDYGPHDHEMENGPTRKKTSSAIQLVIEDDVVEWMDVPMKQVPKVTVESKFVKRNDNYVDENYNTSQNSVASVQNYNTSQNSVTSIPNGDVVDFNKKNFSDNDTSEPVIYANIQKPAKSHLKKRIPCSSSTSNSNSMAESDEDHMRTDKRISFKEDSGIVRCSSGSLQQKGSNQSIAQDDHIYAVVSNKHCPKRNIENSSPEITTNYHSSLPRPKKDRSKGLSRSNTYIHTDYNLIQNKFQGQNHLNSNNNNNNNNDSNKMVEKAMESRQTQAMIYKLKGSSSAEAVANPVFSSPKKVKHAQSQSSIYRATSCNAAHNYTGSLPRRLKHHNHVKEEEKKPALPLRSMSRKKPNELFKSQRTMSTDIATSKEKSVARVPERNLKPYKATKSATQQQKTTTTTLTRAESMKLKGEEPCLYASIRKKTASESKESFLKRMDTANTVERMQMERMEAARQKAMEKASQEDINSSSKTTEKRKSLPSKTPLNQTSSITVHGIPVRRNANVSKNTEIEDNKEFSFKHPRRHSSSSNSPIKSKTPSKLKRVASLPKSAELSKLKDGIKNQLVKGKAYPQKSFEFLTEESMKKYKYVRDTLRAKNICLRDKRGKTGDMLQIDAPVETRTLIKDPHALQTNTNSMSRQERSVNQSNSSIKQSSSEQSFTFQNGGLKYSNDEQHGSSHLVNGVIHHYNSISSHHVSNDSAYNTINTTNNSHEYLAMKNYDDHRVEPTTKNENDDFGTAKEEAIYENASNYSHIRSSGETNITQNGDLGQQVTGQQTGADSSYKYSFSDADLTSLSNDEDDDESLSWQRYYATGETTPHHSLLSLV